MHTYCILLRLLEVYTGTYSILLWCNYEARPAATRSQCDFFINFLIKKLFYQTENRPISVFYQSFLSNFKKYGIQLGVRGNNLNISDRSVQTPEDCLFWPQPPCLHLWAVVVRNESSTGTTTLFSASLQLQPSDLKRHSEFFCRLLTCLQLVPNDAGDRQTTAEARRSCPGKLNFRLGRRRAFGGRAFGGGIISGTCRERSSQATKS